MGRNLLLRPGSGQRHEFFQQLQGGFAIKRTGRVDRVTVSPSWVLAILYRVFDGCAVEHVVNNGVSVWKKRQFRFFFERERELRTLRWLKSSPRLVLRFRRWCGSQPSAQNGRQLFARMCLSRRCVEPRSRPIGSSYRRCQSRHCLGNNQAWNGVFKEIVWTHFCNILRCHQRHVPRRRWQFWGESAEHRFQWVFPKRRRRDRSKAFRNRFQRCRTIHSHLPESFHIRSSSRGFQDAECDPKLQLLSHWHRAIGVSTNCCRRCLNFANKNCQTRSSSTNKILTCHCRLAVSAMLSHSGR